MHIKRYGYWAVALALAACSADEGEKPFVAGEPVNLTISLAASPDSIDEPTRALATPTTGTVFIRSNMSSVTKSYTYSGGSFVSENPLVWLAKNMTVTGYYYRINGAAGELTYVYTVDKDRGQTSYCSGKADITYPNKVNLQLRQQLAKITIQVTADDGTKTVQSNPRLGGNMLYTTGTFDPTTFNANGYATGGADGTGWSPATNTNKQTINMTTASSSGGVYTYTAVILPQKISDTSTPFFTVDVGPNASTVLTTVKYKLAAATTFKAGYSYTLTVDNVTNTLYIQSGIQVEDFAKFNANGRAVTDARSATWTTS